MVFSSLSQTEANETSDSSKNASAGRATSAASGGAGRSPGSADDEPYVWRGNADDGPLERARSTPGGKGPGPRGTGPGPSSRSTRFGSSAASDASVWKTAANVREANSASS